MKSFKLTCLIISTLSLLACSSGGGGGGSTVDNISDRVIETKADTIISSTGGTITIPDEVSVTIPAGAIDTDTEITLTRVETDGLIANTFSDITFLSSASRPKTSRPKKGGVISLSLYLNDPKASLEDTQAYAYEEGGIVYPVNSRKENNEVIIDNPEIAVYSSIENPRLLGADETDKLPGLERSTGYFLAKNDPQFSRQCTKGEAGEIHEEEGHVFRMILEVPMDCALVKSLSLMLQNAYLKYNILYRDNEDNPPFAHLSEDNRMKAYIGKYVANGEYKFYLSWNGYILINAGAAQSNIQLMEKSLYHEMFHAVEDIYSNMIVAGSLAMWWYEATAEWAGFAARDKTFEDLVSFEINLYPELLSVPIQESRQYRKGTLSYGYSTLISYVESQSPGYVRDTLLGWDVTSSDLYQYMVMEGNLGDGYSDFVKKFILAGNTTNFWKNVSFFEEDDQTSLTTRPTDVLGETDFDNTVLSADAERFKTHSFTLNIRPLTTQFILFEAKPELLTSRNLTINLTTGGTPSGNALLYTVLYQGSGGSMTQLDAGGSLITGLGGEIRSVYIAIFNNDTTETKEFKVDIKNEKGEKNLANISSSFSIDSENWSIGPRADSFGSVSGSGIPEYESTGGGDDYWYFRAPSKFYGDLSSFYGKSLSFDMKQSNPNPGIKLAPFVVLQTVC